MAVFDFSNYRSPSEARALESQAFAERQINNAIASQRANTLAMAQAAAMNRDFGLRQQDQQSLQKYRDNTLSFQQSASKQAAQDRARQYELEREKFDYAKQLDETRKALAQQQSSVQMAQLAAQKKNLDELYNRLEVQKQAIKNQTGSGWFEWDSTAQKNRDAQIKLLQDEQDTLLKEAYIPLGLTPGSPVRSESLANMVQSGMQNLGSGNGILSRLAMLTRTNQGSSKGQEEAVTNPQEVVDNSYAPSGAINWATVPQSRAKAVAEEPVPNVVRSGRNRNTAFAVRPSDEAYSPPVNASSRNRNTAGAMNKPKLNYSGLSGAVNWTTVPPVDETTIKQTLQSMTDYFENQGLSPEEAAAQAYSEAKQETPLFRQFRSK